jgi:hypothetical protein
MTLKQLREVIQDIYTQKMRYDGKCKEGKLARETMEQYMYTYLNQKYGLKALILEASAAILNGLKTFASSDTEVALFAKVLKNECEEEFRLVLPKIRESLREATKDAWMRKHKHGTEGDVALLLEELNEGKTLMDEWLWTDVVEKMYAPADRTLLLQRIKEVLKDNVLSQYLTQDRRVAKSRQDSPSKPGRGLGYAEFVKVFKDDDNV